ncbi:MAG: hypothetical protein ABSC01_05455 [Verrucomicrobiota bacterium]
MVWFHFLALSSTSFISTGGRPPVCRSPGEGRHNSYTRRPVNSTAFQIPNSELRSYFTARGEADAPDIDGRVYVRGRLPIGEFARVKVVGYTDYDLIAERV